MRSMQHSDSTTTNTRCPIMGKQRTFVCQGCGERKDWHGEQFTERIEMRSVDGNERPFAKIVAYWCRDCMFRRVSELKNEAPDTQESLL
jgi:hypothetical protein